MYVVKALYSYSCCCVWLALAPALLLLLPRLLLCSWCRSCLGFLALALAIALATTIAIATTITLAADQALALVFVLVLATALL